MQILRLPDTSTDSGMIYSPNSVEFPAFYRETLEDEVRIALFTIAKHILKSKLFSNPKVDVKYSGQIDYPKLINRFSGNEEALEYIAFLKHFFPVIESKIHLNRYNEAAVREIADFIQKNLMFIPPFAIDSAVQASLEGVTGGSTLYYYIPQYKHKISDFNSDTSTNSNEYMLKKVIVEARKRGIRIEIISDNDLFSIPDNVDIRVVDDISFSGTQLSKATSKLFKHQKFNGRVKLFLAAANIGTLKNQIPKENRSKVDISCQYTFPDPNLKLDESLLTENVRQFFGQYLHTDSTNSGTFIAKLTEHIGTKYVRTLYKNPDNISSDSIVHSSYFQPGEQDEFTDERNLYYKRGLSGDLNDLSKTRQYPKVEGYP